MGATLSNGLDYSGNYQFQQVGWPQCSGSGVAGVSVEFAGAAPLAAAFISRLRRKNLPTIVDNGTLGAWASGSRLIDAFEGWETDGGKVYTRVVLRFAVPATDSPTKIDEATTDFGSTRQSATVIFTSEITYEVQFMAPTATIHWVTTTKPVGPKSATPGAELGKADILRAYWKNSEGKVLIDQDPDYVPPQEIRCLGWDAKEVLPGVRWECWATWARVFLTYYLES